MAGSIISVSLYLTHYQGDDKLDADMLHTILGSLGAIWLVSAVTFISVINRNYRNTFYSLDTASDYKRKCFLSARGDQDDLKSKILKDHPGIYSSWGDELLKPWTLRNWDRWEEEKPAWFTDKWIDHVPNEYIPYDWRVKYNKTKGRVEDPQMRRRSSVQQVKMLMGGEDEK